eukprot:scaffold156159_cov30-Tisochrysis_lutea.AAC.4
MEGPQCPNTHAAPAPGSGGTGGAASQNFHKSEDFCSTIIWRASVSHSGGYFDEVSRNVLEGC